MTKSDETFPIDWNEWRRQWKEWRERNAKHLRPSSYPFPEDKNFLADEILGKWSVGDRAVELSEVTFTLGENTKRYVGVTIGAATQNRDAYIVESWAELERELGIPNDDESE